MASLEMHAPGNSAAYTKHSHCPGPLLGTAPIRQTTPFCTNNGKCTNVCRQGYGSHSDSRADRDQLHRTLWRRQVNAFGRFVSCFPAPFAGSTAVGEAAPLLCISWLRAHGSASVAMAAVRAAARARISSDRGAWQLLRPWMCVTLHLWALGPASANATVARNCRMVVATVELHAGDLAIMPSWPMTHVRVDCANLSTPSSSWSAPSAASASAPVPAEHSKGPCFVLSHCKIVQYNDP